jgi:hypothetical protein
LSPTSRFSHQDKAGELKEAEGDYPAAITLYLRGGRPAKAAQLMQVMKHPCFKYF